MSSSDEHEPVHPARVEALSRKLTHLTERVEELETENTELRKELSQVNSKLEGIGANEIDPNTPDKRALRIRKWLYEQANQDPHGKASLNKNVAKGILGSRHREQIYEAMRRAANGNDGARSGSSSLSPVQGIEYESFEDPDRLSRVRIDLEDVTTKLGRNIIESRLDGNHGESKFDNGGDA